MDNQQLWQQRMEEAVQRNANQIQTLKHVLEDLVRRSPSPRELQGWQKVLASLEPLDLQEFLNQPTKKGR